jgi:hypothetical protein
MAVFLDILVSYMLDSKTGYSVSALQRKGQNWGTMLRSVHHVFTHTHKTSDFELHIFLLFGLIWFEHVHKNGHNNLHNFLFIM